MVARSSKLDKKRGKKPDEFENAIAKAISDLESNNDLRAQLQELKIKGAKQIDLAGKKAVIIWVPVPQLKQFQKIQTRLVRELEKKFSGTHVMFVAQRKILPKDCSRISAKYKQKRPRSRTVTNVHNALLDDLVYPAEIVGKRIRVKLDGNKLIRVHLDRSQQTTVEHKVDTFVGVYKRLTGKDVTFEFPEPAI